MLCSACLTQLAIEQVVLHILAKCSWSIANLFAATSRADESANILRIEQQTPEMHFVSMGNDVQKCDHNCRFILT